MELVKKFEARFLEKMALQKAMEALEEKLEKEIVNDLNKIFQDLENELSKHKFILVSHGHLDEPMTQIFNLGNDSDNDTTLFIKNFKVDEIVGELDDNFKEVISITKKFLANL